MDIENSLSDVLRFVGVMAICIGVAWSLQILGFGDVTSVNRLIWIVSAAAIAGAGVGTILASSSMREREVPARI